MIAKVSHLSRRRNLQLLHFVWLGCGQFAEEWVVGRKTQSLPDMARNMVIQSFQFIFYFSLKLSISKSDQSFSQIYTQYLIILKTMSFHYPVKNVTISKQIDAQFQQLLKSFQIQRASKKYSKEWSTYRQESLYEYDLKACLDLVVKKCKHYQLVMETAENIMVKCGWIKKKTLRIQQVSSKFSEYAKYAAQSQLAQQRLAELKGLLNAVCKNQKNKTMDNTKKIFETSALKQEDKIIVTEIQMMKLKLKQFQEKEKAQLNYFQENNKIMKILQDIKKFTEKKLLIQQIDQIYSLQMKTSLKNFVDYLINSCPNITNKNDTLNKFISAAVLPETSGPDLLELCYMMPKPQKQVVLPLYSYIVKMRNSQPNPGNNTRGSPVKPEVAISYYDQSEIQKLQLQMTVKIDQIQKLQKENQKLKNQVEALREMIPEQIDQNKRRTKQVKDYHTQKDKNINIAKIKQKQEKSQDIKRIQQNVPFCKGNCEELQRELKQLKQYVKNFENQRKDYSQMQKQLQILEKQNRQLKDQKQSFKEPPSKAEERLEWIISSINSIKPMNRTQLMRFKKQLENKCLILKKDRTVVEDIIEIRLKYEDLVQPKIPNTTAKVDNRYFQAQKKRQTEQKAKKSQENESVDGLMEKISELQQQLRLTSKQGQQKDRLLKELKEQISQLKKSLIQKEEKIKNVNSDVERLNSQLITKNQKNNQLKNDIQILKAKVQSIEMNSLQSNKFIQSSNQQQQIRLLRINEKKQAANYAQLTEIFQSQKKQCQKLKGQLQQCKKCYQERDQTREKYHRLQQEYKQFMESQNIRKQRGGNSIQEKASASYQQSKIHEQQLRRLKQQLSMKEVTIKTITQGYQQNMTKKEEKITELEISLSLITNQNPKENRELIIFK